MAERGAPEDARKLGLTLRVVLPVVILSVGIGAMSAIKLLKKEPEKKPHTATVRTVDTYTVTKGRVQVKLFGYGTLRSSKTIHISPEVNGNVLTVATSLENGNVINKGDTLFTIDPKDYEYALDGLTAEAGRLEAELALLEQSVKDNNELLKIRERSRELNLSELKRLKRLLDEGSSVSRSSVEAAEMRDIAAMERILMLKQETARVPLRKKSIGASLERVRSQIKQSRLTLSRCTVKSPLSGRLQNVQVEAGQVIGPGQVVASIADDSLLELEVGLPLNDVLAWLPLEQTPAGQWVKPKGDVLASLQWVDTSGNGLTNALLDRVSSVDETTRTAKLIFRLPPDRNATLLSGMFCRVTVHGKWIEDGMLIPREAVTADNQVGVIEQGVFRTKTITILHPQREHVLLAVPDVDSGDFLKPGDDVILSPSTTLLDGQPVKALPKATD